tara:strand:- start:157 stop:423 length:267 start_codon:yes stop_codon:yes gene_type:complete
MSKEPQIQENEVKTKVAKRVPPGDRWAPLSNTTVTLDSLTDVLEFIYQDTGKTQFYMDAREGYVYIVDKEEIVIEPEPEKRWSLYGEE